MTCLVRCRHLIDDLACAGKHELRKKAQSKGQANKGQKVQAPHASIVSHHTAHHGQRKAEVESPKSMRLAPSGHSKSSRASTPGAHSDLASAPSERCAEPTSCSSTGSRIQSRQDFRDAVKGLKPLVLRSSSPPPRWPPRSPP